MYSSTNRSSTSQVPDPPSGSSYTSFGGSSTPGSSSYTNYMGRNSDYRGRNPDYRGRNPSQSRGSSEGQSDSSFGFNSFGFPSFNVQNLTQSLSNQFNPANFSSFMTSSGQSPQSGQQTGQSSRASASQPRPSGPSRSQSTPSTSESSEKYCEHCCTKFNYFKRRRTCIECCMDYCSNCFTSDTFLGTQSSRIGSGRQTCRKCRILKLNPPDRYYLNTLRVKDLRWYIDRKGMSLNGCKEKSELIDLILTHHGYRPSNSSVANSVPSSYRETSRSRRAAEDVLLRGQSLDDNRESGQTQNRSDSSSPSSDASSWVLVEDEGQIGGSGVIGAVGGAAPTHSYPPPDLVRDSRSDTQQTGESDPDQSAPVTSTSDQSASDQGASDTNYLQHPTVSSSSGRDSPSFYSGSPSRASALACDPTTAFNIDDVQSEDQLHSLTVRQFKLILTRNFVDYKGCCERDELLEKVIRLWREKKAFKEQNPDEIPDENLCKICMENPIDCVLLECGHMISCVNCGKRLAECPICRQYVVRVVRTFKS